MFSKEEIEGGHKLYYHNGVYMGDVLQDCDGFFKFWPDRTKSGYWDEGMLLEIASHLANENADWNREIEEYFSKVDNMPAGMV